VRVYPFEKISLALNLSPEKYSEQTPWVLMWRALENFIKFVTTDLGRKDLAATVSPASFRAMVSSTGKVSYDSLLQLVAQTTPEAFKELVGYPFLLGWGVREGEVVPKEAFSRSATKRSTMLFRPQRIFEEMQEMEAIRKIVYALVSSTGTGLGEFGEHTIGSSAESSITLPDFAVSTHHARISYRNERYVLFDLKSTNGTFVNGSKVPESGRILEDRDLVAFGRYEFIFAFPESLHRQLKRRLST
jgi:hypothetical protein